MIQLGCEAISAGTWPDPNFYQFRGSPMISIGTYALSYPGTLLSCGLSQLMFGDLNSVIEIFAILHLLAGYYLTYRWARLLGINPVFSITLGISLVLSGYFFVAGRSWYYMFPVALWLPVLLLSAENFIRSRADGAGQC